MCREFGGPVAKDAAKSVCCGWNLHASQNRHQAHIGQGLAGSGEEEVVCLIAIYRLQYLQRIDGWLIQRNVVFPANLRALRADVSHAFDQINFRPSGSSNFCRPRRCQNGEFQGACTLACLHFESLHEIDHLTHSRGRIVMNLGHLGRFREGCIQVAPPAYWVQALGQAVCSGEVEHPLNATAHARRSLGLAGLDGLEYPNDVNHSDVTNQERVDDWVGISLQGVSPLR